MPNNELLFRAFEERDAEILRAAVQYSLQTSPVELFLHPLGFYMTKLAQQERVSIRLHYWAKECRGTGAALTPYHDHVWNLSSCVLVGSIDNIPIDVIADASGEYRLAEIEQQEGVDKVITSKARVKIEYGDREHQGPGTFYDVAAGTFHFSELNPSETAITVVRAELVDARRPRTLVREGASAYAPARIPVSNSSELVGEVLRALSHAAP